MKLKILDLFSGIGGFSLGLEATGHFETAAFCEIDPYCKQVLKKHWPDVPIFDDIRQLKGTDIGTIDIITGGYPCQPFSVAGKQKAEQDPRHLWPEYFRLIQELKPTWVIGENVSGHIKLGLDSVLEDLASEGYSSRTFSISAASIGANHKRERVWTVAYSSRIADAMRGIDYCLSKESGSWSYYEGRGRGNANGISHPSTNERLDSEDVAYSNDSRDRTSQHETNSNREKINEGWQEQSFSEPSRQSEDVENSRRTLWQRGQFSKENEDEIGKENANQFERSSSTSKIDVANTDSKRLQRQRESSSQFNKKFTTSKSSEERQKGLGGKWWESEPRVGRVAHGIPKRVDRLKTLGNAVVPHIPYYIGQAIVESYQ
jgi:DNA (cytosine-5)-methyltransferase 1